MVNVVGVIRDFLDVNFHALPPSWQYTVVAVGAACLPVLQQAVTTALSTHHWDWNEIWKECITAIIAAHIAQRVRPPSQSKVASQKVGE
jgi:hypothetical protein